MCSRSYTPGMRRTLLAGAFALLLAACGGGDQERRLTGTIEFPDVEVGSLVGGRVVRVLKQEGDRAAAQDVLVELDPAEWQSHLEEAEALAAAAERELALLEAGPREETIEEARADAKRAELLWTISTKGAREEEIQAAREELRAADVAVEGAQREVDRLTGLARKQVEPTSVLDTARTARDTAQAKQAVAQQHLKLLEAGQRPEEIEAMRQAWLAQVQRVKALEAGARPEEIAAKRASVAAAKARIAVAESQLRELAILAPADSVVQTLDLRPGDLLKPGVSVAVLLLAEQPWVTVYVPEDRLAAVHVGQSARITPDGHNPLTGKVTWVSREAEYTPRNVQTREERVTQVFAVKIVLQGDTSQLKDGMWADIDLL